MCSLDQRGDGEMENGGGVTHTKQDRVLREGEGESRVLFWTLGSSD